LKSRRQALAHDQLGKLRTLLAEAKDDGGAPVCPGIRVDTLDGDTGAAKPAVLGLNFSFWFCLVCLEPVLVNPRVLDRDGLKQKAPFRAGYRDRPAIIAGAHVILTNPVRTETKLVNV
jgi:ATP-dependent helicase YprA (DUF1998 family)